MSFNRIILVGNLGKDPELRYTPQGNPVCSFSLATNERRRASAAGGEQSDITTWFRVTLWGKQAETAAQYLQRGRPVYIEGKLRVEEYTDKEGKLRHSLEVSATDMQFIGRGEPGGDAGGGRPVTAVRPTPPAGVPTSSGGDWALKEGRPVRRSAPAHREEAADVIAGDEKPFVRSGKKPAASTVEDFDDSEIPF